MSSLPGGTFRQVHSQYTLLLPAHLRHQLVCHLPAFDLHKLEGTPVVSGLDISTYWQALYDYFRKTISPECKYCHCYQCSEFESNSTNKNRGPKENVLSLAESHVVQEIISLIQEITRVTRVYSFCMRRSSRRVSSLHALLLSFPVQFSSQKEINALTSPATFEHAGLCYFDSVQRVVIPSRLTSLIVPWKKESTNCVLSLMKILLDHFNCQSRYLPLYEPVHAIFGADSNNWRIVEQFLSQVETVCCVSGGQSCGSPNIDAWTNILRANFCAKDTLSRLTKLKLNNWNYESFYLSMDLLSPYLGSSTPSLHLQTYKGLKEIEIYSLWDNKDSKSTDNPLYKFAAIVNNQEQLKTLHLHGRFMATPQFDAVMLAVARLMEKESMESVKLCGFGNTQLNIESVSKVVFSFLFTPTSHKQFFQLSVQGVSTTGKQKKMIDTHFEECSHIASTVDGQCMKSLRLDIEQLPSLFPILSKVSVPITLNTIELDIGGPAEKHSLLPNISAISVILNLIETGDLVPESHTRCAVGATARALILNGRITHLCVSSQTLILPSSYLEGLGKVIAQHAEQFQTLKSIKIRNGLDEEKSSVNDSFCESLVSLAQVVPFELRLENMPKHLKKVNKVWKKKKCAKRFSKIVHIPSLYSRNIDEDNKKAVSLMFDIADTTSTDKSAF